MRHTLEVGRLGKGKCSKKFWPAENWSRETASQNRWQTCICFPKGSDLGPITIWVIFWTFHFLLAPFTPADGFWEAATFPENQHSDIFRLTCVGMSTGPQLRGHAEMFVLGHPPG